MSSKKKKRQAAERLRNLAIADTQKLSKSNQTLLSNLSIKSGKTATTTVNATTAKTVIASKNNPTATATIGKNDAKTPAVKELTSNERNIALIAMSKIKDKGKNMYGLIIPTLKSVADSYVELESLEDNADQIKFCKQVWNYAAKPIRKMFLQTDSQWFINLASDINMTPILQDALQKFNMVRNNGSSGNDLKSDWMEIVGKYNDAKRKQATLTPFSEQLTPSEIRLIEKHESLLQEQEGVERVARDTHNPNESAVSYPYILGRLIETCGLHENRPVNPNLLGKWCTDNKNIVLDILHFVAVHGQKTQESFQKSVIGYGTVAGPISNVDIKPYLDLLVESLVKGTNVEADKHIANHELTLKRIVRLVHICTKHSTVWGIMTNQTDFVSNIKELHDLENSLKNRDMNSLSIVWYLCLGRENICSIMVDHHELSAGKVLSEIVGKTSSLEGRERPDWAFPFDKPVADKFDVPARYVFNTDDPPNDEVPNQNEEIPDDPLVVPEVPDDPLVVQIPDDQNKAESSGDESSDSEDSSDDSDDESKTDTL